MDISKNQYRSTGGLACLADTAFRRASSISVVCPINFGLKVWLENPHLVRLDRLYRHIAFVTPKKKYRGYTLVSQCIATRVTKVIKFQPEC